MNSNSNTSPLETMASYAIAFLAGAMATALVATYGDWREAKARDEDLRQSTEEKS
jgi:hypothetical protein